MDAGSIGVRLGLNTDDLQAGLGRAKSSLLEWRNETNANSSDMLKWGTALSATAVPLAAVGYALVETTNRAAAFGKAIKDNARDLGLSTEEYQKWAHVAIASGSSAEKMTDSIRQMTIRLKEASDPASDAARYLKAMGVSAYDSNGKLRDTNSVMLDLIPALNALPEGMDRNQASMVLFGKSFSNIADLTSLTRDELQKLMDQAPVFSDEKIDKMNEYATQTALLNEQIQIMSVDLGEDLIPLAEDVITVFKELGPLIKDVAGFLHEGATGTVMMSQGLQLLYTQWRYGMESPEMKALQAQVQEYYESELNERSGYTDMTSYGAADARRRFGGPSLYVPPAAKSSSGLTQDEIVSKQIELSRKTIETAQAEREYQELKKKTNDWQSTGVKTQLEFNEKMELARLRAVALKNECAEITAELQKAGVAAAAVASGPTYNSLFASSLNSGGVGPDTAGYSDLANMSASELQAIIDKAAKGGGSKGMAEKAQTYLSMMKTSGKSAGTPAAKDLSSGSAGQTAAITTEYDNQAKALQTLTSTTETEYQKQTEAFRTHLDALNEYRAEQYPVLEKQDLTHQATSTEIAKAAGQKQLDYMTTLVNFGGTNPIVQNYIVMSAKGPDWTPPAFQAVTSPKLESADFTSVGSAVQAIVAKGLGQGASGSGVKVEINQTFNGVDHTTGEKNRRATLRAVSEGLAGVNYCGGLH